MNGQGRKTEDNKIKDTEREENTQENEERYTKEDERTLTIKEPDIAKELTKNNQHILLYTKINVKCRLSNEYLVM